MVQHYYRYLLQLEDCVSFGIQNTSLFKLMGNSFFDVLFWFPRKPYIKFAFQYYNGSGVFLDVLLAN